MSSRVILITGANGGLGQAIARAFLQESSANLLWLGVRTRREHADLSGRFNPFVEEVSYVDDEVCPFGDVGNGLRTNLGDG